MYCTRCGKENKETARFCEQCGAFLSSETPQEQPKTAYDPYAQSGNTYNSYAQPGNSYDPYTAGAPETPSYDRPAEEPVLETSEPMVFGKLAQIFGYLSFLVGPAPAIVMASIGFSKYKHPANRARCKKGLIWGIVGGVSMFVLSYLFGILLGILMYL